MYHKIYAFLLSCLIMSSTNPTITLMRHEVQIPEKLGDIYLTYEKNQFFVHKDDEIIPVQNAYVDNILHNVSSKQLKNFLGREQIRRYKLFNTIAQAQEAGFDINDFEILNDEETEAFLSEIAEEQPANYISVSQTHDGEYILRAKTRIVGGGAFGAWLGCWIGKAAVHVGGQALLALAMAPVYITAGPLIAAPIHKGLASTIAPALEATSIAVGCAVGIAGAVATGPA